MILLIFSYAFLKAKIIPSLTCLIDVIDIAFLSRPFNDMRGCKTTVAFTLLSLRKFDKKSFSELHPGGKIGKKLKTLNEIMDTDIPIINTQSSIIDAVLIMTEKNGRGLAFPMKKFLDPNSNAI